MSIASDSVGDKMGIPRTDAHRRLTGAVWDARIFLYKGYLKIMDILILDNYVNYIMPIFAGIV